MFIKVLILFFSCFEIIFSLTNNFNNDALIRKNGSHFSCLIPGVGTLIHPQWCLAAAHFSPVVGTSFTVDNDNFLIEKVIIHPFHEVSFKPYNYLYKDEGKIDRLPSISPTFDIALVKINKPILTRSFIERERDDSSRSSRNWIVSGKDKILKAGLVRLCNVQKDVFYKSWTQKTLQPLIPRNISLFFHTSQADFKEKKYTFSAGYNKVLELSKLNLEQEDSDLSVIIEPYDSGSPTFNFPSSYKTNLPELKDLKLTGITSKRLTPPNDSIINGHMGIIQRLSHIGINEFIDTIQLQDALGVEVNALVHNLSREYALKDHTIKKSDLINTDAVIAYSLPSVKINDSWFITPKASSQPVFLHRYSSSLDTVTGNKKYFLSFAPIKGFIDVKNSRFLKISDQESNYSNLKYFSKDSNQEEVWTVCYAASNISTLPIDFEYSFIRNILWDSLNIKK